MSKVNVLHITTVGSSLRYLLLDQMIYLQQHGYQVSAMSAPGGDVVCVERSGIRHIPIAMRRRISPLADLQTIQRLVAAMRRERPMIVHTHTPKPGLLGQIAARLARVPIVVNTLHGFYFHERMAPATRRFYVELERVAARCSDRILSQSNEDIQTALREGICTRDKIRLLGNGINLNRFDPRRVAPRELEAQRAGLGIPAGAPVLGFVGRLAARRKGFLDFLRAGQLLVERYPNLHFLIVGEADHGKDDAVDPELAQTFGLWEHCHFLGQRPNSELPGLYALMDVLALPSLFEGVPRALMEGAAMSLPLVATDVKGNREVVAHGQNGLLVPFADSPALAEAIGGLLAMPELAHSMGIAGRRIAEERFDEQRVFARVRDEYASLLAARGLPAPEVPRQSGTETSVRQSHVPGRA